MQKILIAAAAALALAACTPAEKAQTKADVKDAAADIHQAGQDVAASPVVQKAGDSLKEAAHDTGTVLKDAAKGAVSGAREGMAKAEGDRREDEPAKK